MAFLNKHFSSLFWILSGLTFLSITLRAFLIPFSHDETATFFYYIQSDNYLPYLSHAYTNNHILNSALANLCYHIFGSHPFALRLPNVLSFLLLCYAIYEFFPFFNRIGSKLLLISFFLLTFCFLDVFALCRGYGISIACMMCGLAFCTHYLKTKTLGKAYKALFFFQLALSANLTLLPAICCVFLVLLLVQYSNKHLLHPKSILIWLLNFAILIFWVKLTLFYKSAGLLDSGSPHHYWKTSFVSLIEFIFGSKLLWLQLCCCLAAIFIGGISVYQWHKMRYTLRYFLTPLGFFSLCFFSMIIGFWLLNLLAGINFPEDRTGLFYYLFFALSLSFGADYLSEKITDYCGLLLMVVSSAYFILSFNVSHFSSYFYHTMPVSIFETLKEEQAKAKEPFTIGGNAARELNYAFLNYRSNYALNPMNIENTLQLNMDYIFAHVHEKPYYEALYNEIAFDKTWNRALLKRKTPIEHVPVRNFNTAFSVNTSNEFTNLFQLKDTSFRSKNPLETEICLQFNKVPDPFNAFLVFSFTDAKNEKNDYRRIYLNWAGKNLNGKALRLKLTSTNLPYSLSDVTAYIWNIDKKPVQITCKSARLYQLKGKGVNFIVPESYYPMISSVTQQIQL